MSPIEIIKHKNHRAELVYLASEYHYAGKSIPVQLFEKLCKVGETPSLLWREFNDSEGVNIPLFPLNTEES